MQTSIRPFIRSRKCVMMTDKPFYYLLGDADILFICYISCMFIVCVYKICNIISDIV